MNLADLYLRYGNKDNFPARYRVMAGANNRHEKNMISKWQKYFNTEDENDKISIVEDIVVHEYEHRNKKVPYSIDFREYARAYIVRADLEESEVEDYLLDKYGRG